MNILKTWEEVDWLDDCCVINLYIISMSKNVQNNCNERKKESFINIFLFLDNEHKKYKI